MPVVASGSDAMQQAADLLTSGGVVAFPTETVYGLGCSTLNEVAINRVYDLKGRPADNPLIAHVLDRSWVADLATGWDANCDALADACWPGPLTIILPRDTRVPQQATAGYDTIALRSPRHDVARGLLAAHGGPISAPSANRSGHVSPTTAVHVAQEFAGVEDLLILDGGPCEEGIESTILSMAGEPTILRPGSVTAGMIDAVIGRVAEPTIDSQTHAPGTSTRHYAPQRPVWLCDRADFESHLSNLDEPCAALVCTEMDVPPPHKAIMLGDDPVGYARRLYAALREADSLGVSTILIESPPAAEAWRAIHDRLRRAAISAVPRPQ